MPSANEVETLKEGLETNTSHLQAQAEHLVRFWDQVKEERLYMAPSVDAVVVPEVYFSRVQLNSRLIEESWVQSRMQIVD